MANIKVCNDGFKWEVVSAETAKQILREGKKEVYRLYEDDSEGLIEDIDEIDLHASMGGHFGCEVED